jgi:hypothetical protein
MRLKIFYQYGYNSICTNGLPIAGFYVFNVGKRGPSVGGRVHKGAPSYRGGVGDSTQEDRLKG